MLGTMPAMHEKEKGRHGGGFHKGVHRAHLHSIGGKPCHAHQP
jgi:hypothetical protein